MAPVPVVPIGTNFPPRLHRLFVFQSGEFPPEFGYSATRMRNIGCFVYEIAAPPDFSRFWVFHGFCNKKPSKVLPEYFIPFQMSRTSEDYMKIVAAKLGALLGICVLSFICGILPYYSIRAFRSRFPTATAQKITSGFICFSAGTLLGVAFLHLLPEVREKIAQLQSERNCFIFPKSLPLSDIIAMSGFFGVYLLDELLHMCVEWYSWRMKRVKSATRNKKSDSSSDKICPQLPHDLSVFSLDKHESSKHQVSICRRSNHHSIFLRNCVCQSTNSGEAIAEKETNPGQGSSITQEEVCPTTTPMSGLITIAALSFHDIFEGIAIGVEQNLNSILFLFLSIASHKYAIAFCIGMDLVAAGSRLKTIVLSMMIFSVVSPIGVIIGMIVITENNPDAKYQIDSPASVVMQGIAGGSLIYVVCFEVLQREGTDTHKKGIQNVMFVICGFLVTLGFKILTGHSHSR